MIRLPHLLLLLLMMTMIPRIVAGSGTMPQVKLTPIVKKNVKTRAKFIEHLRKLVPVLEAHLYCKAPGLGV
jgi:hypothetical protein